MWNFKGNQESYICSSLWEQINLCLAIELRILRIINAHELVSRKRLAIHDLTCDHRLHWFGETNDKFGSKQNLFPRGVSLPSTWTFLFSWTKISARTPVKNNIPDLTSEIQRNLVNLITSQSFFVAG